MDALLRSLSLAEMVANPEIHWWNCPFRVAFHFLCIPAVSTPKTSWSWRRIPCGEGRCRTEWLPDYQVRWGSELRINTAVLVSRRQRPCDGWKIVLHNTPPPFHSLLSSLCSLNAGDSIGVWLFSLLQCWSLLSHSNSYSKPFIIFKIIVTHYQKMLPWISPSAAIIWA